jgi:hypothetical protein
MTEEALNVTQACKRLGRSRQWFYNLCTGRVATSTKNGVVYEYPERPELIEGVHYTREGPKKTRVTPAGLAYMQQLIQRRRGHVQIRSKSR